MSNAGTDTSIVLDAAGNPVVSYTGGGVNVFVVHCGNPTCTAGNVITTPDTTGTVGEYSSIALTAAGNPVVSYYDSTNGDLKVLICGDPTCSAGNTIRSLDNSDNSGVYTSLALDAAGNPVIGHIAFVGGIPHDVAVLHCGNPTCAGPHQPVGAGAAQAARATRRR